MRKNDCLLIAHRGSSFEAPENTLSAVMLAWKENADAVEIDIRLTKDNQVVVIHDASAKRTGGLNKKISGLNLAELRGLDFGNWKDVKWKGEKIPRLSEVLQTMPEGKKLFIEIKCGPEIIEPLQKILSSGIVNPSRLVLMHFDLNTLIQTKNVFPNIKILWLYEFLPVNFGSAKNKLKNIINTAATNKFSGVNIENKKKLDANFIHECKKNDLECFCWTVNNPERAVYLIESGISGITTDRPGWLRQNLNLIKD